MPGPAFAGVYLYRPNLPLPSEGHGIDRADDLTLHDLVLFDGEMTDTRYALDIHIFQRAMQTTGRLDRLTIAIGDVEIDVASDAPVQTGAKHRIQADRQFDGRAKLVEPRHHVR